MGYSTRDAADLLGLPLSRIRAWARDGVLTPGTPEGDDASLSFQDVVLLRAARELLDADVPVRRVRRALLDLRHTLPDGRPLSAVRISSRGGAVVVMDEGGTWEPGSHQLHLDLVPAGARAACTQPAAEAAPATPRPSNAALPEPEADRVVLPWSPAPMTLPSEADGRTADAWYEAGLVAEAEDPNDAKAAYRRALELDPGHVDAHLNLGRILHEEGALAEAEEHYRSALTADPESARACYNLGVALEDGGRAAGAVEAYQAALRLDPALAVAHFNLSRLLEREGRAAEALGHLAEYKRLSERSGRGG